MKNSIPALLLTFLVVLNSCKKDDSETPVPDVVGVWNVTQRYKEVATGTFRPSFEFNYELELNEHETGWRRDFFNDQPFEWDLINGDQTILLSYRTPTTTGDTVWVVDIYEILSQSADSAVWVSPTDAYFGNSVDSLEGPYRQHLTLIKK